MYLWLARFVVLVHLSVLLVLIFGAGAFITGRFGRLQAAWQTLVLAGFGGFVLSQIFLHDCALTRWEKALRAHALAGSAYQGSFLQHYLPFLAKITDGFSAEIAVLAGALLAAMILRAIHAWWRRSARRGAADA
jgi:hypothetical protein